MEAPIPLRRPVNWSHLRADDAERLIKERAADSNWVIVIGHPEERSDERTILRPDLLRILREGMVVRQPTRNEHGDWEAVIEKRIRGSRDAGVVTIILREKEALIVKTVMWIKR